MATSLIAGNFTLQEPEIKIQTSIGVAIGISMGFSLVYACVCFFVIVVRMRLISGEWTSAKDLVLHNEPASMFNPTDNSVSYPPGSNPQHFTKRHGSVITSSSSLETGSDPALATHELQASGFARGTSMRASKRSSHQAMEMQPVGFS